MINKRISTQNIALLANILDILGIAILLFLTFIFQFVYKELPCPLCLLQRVGFLMTGVGFLLNLRYGLRASHYALALFGALFTAFVALRQMALHIVPGSSSYGSSIFGLHMYTWSFVISMAIVLFTAGILGLDTQYSELPKKIRYFNYILPVLFVVMFLLAATNLISLVMECGLGQCPDSPTNYLW